MKREHSTPEDYTAFDLSIALLLATVAVGLRGVAAALAWSLLVVIVASYHRYTSSDAETPPRIPQAILLKARRRRPIDLAV